MNDTFAAAEIIESDLWEQYTELGGTQDSEESGVSGGSPLYMSALQILDGDMAQYIHDNTDDEKSHFSFSNAYLDSRGAERVNLDSFRMLPSSKASSAAQIGLTISAREPRWPTAAFGPGSRGWERLPRI